MHAAYDYRRAPIVGTLSRRPGFGPRAWCLPVSSILALLACRSSDSAPNAPRCPAQAYLTTWTDVGRLNFRYGHSNSPTADSQTRVSGVAYVPRDGEAHVWARIIELEEDTSTSAHPSLAIPELMRILLDDEELS
ncbi:hypothetical protein B0H17DRAFT_1214252 [Mycena rosella]|uniref:Uncharacterized protein n=1 Tax=Mycena rosella TaxID=1033263 RepID=A0AAD7CR00_MYCRO|nr:hypothetical protein B0H17DRAFT_1214252 [Mycena rosella]